VIHETFTLAATLNTDGIVNEAVRLIVPILCLLIGIGIIASSRKGRISDAASTMTLVIIGLVIIAAGPILYSFADEISSLIIQ
jgi:hypothetical protein